MSTYVPEINSKILGNSYSFFVLYIQAFCYIFHRGYIMSEKLTSIFLTQGGAGDVLAATPMLRYFRNKYPDDEIVVISTYSQLLEDNPNVDKVVPMSDPRDFYEEYVLNRKIRFFKKHFVYDGLMDSPALGCNTLLEFICSMYGAEYDGKPPDYYITDYEKRAAEVFCRQSPKPKVLLHIFGAVPSDGGYGVLVCGGCGGRGIGADGNRCGMCGGSGKIIKRNKTNNLKDLNPETLAPLVKKYSEKYDFLQIGLEAEPLVPGAFDCLGMPMREAIALIPQCESYIFIESLFAHAAGALQKPGVVVFQNTDPVFFSYPVAHVACDSGNCDAWPCNRPVGALLDMLPGYKNPKSRERLLWECPNQKCARMKPEHLEKIFLASLDGKPPRAKDDQGHNSLAAARDAVPPLNAPEAQNIIDLPKKRGRPKKPKRPTGRIIAPTGRIIAEKNMAKEAKRLAATLKEEE
jgi:ADP-heptose:LPS heptosyltransferase